MKPKSFIKSAAAAPLARLQLLLILSVVCLNAAAPSSKVPTPPPLVPADISELPEGTERLDLFLLAGQSNMKGRGFMPLEPANDPRILMKHLRNDQWYRARHPLHLTGHPETFKGHDNAGVGPGLAFAEAVRAAQPNARIGLIPAAYGGSSIGLWGPEKRLYREAVRRTRQALEEGPKGRTHLKAVLWLQGESDAKEGRLEEYPQALLDLVDQFRKDFDDPDLPFIACTIGEMKVKLGIDKLESINEALLSLPDHREHTACVDARDLKGTIGDDVHYDTASQEAIGRRYARKYLELEK